MGLAKLPKLAKKTWADITSESNDDFETDLQTMIQNTKRSKTIVNPKGKQTLSQQKTPPPKPTNSYIYKNKFSIVLQMELEFWDKNPFKATTKAFPPGFHFKPTTTNKTRIFYKFILTNTNSVSIKHFKDLNDTNLNTHSTLQILKVLQPRQFGTNLNQSKKFSVPFDPIGYTFWDYVDARTNVFWHQNSKFKHSWIIYFKTNTIYNFPNWFLKWWNFFGPTSEIYLEQAQQGFDQFKKMFNSQKSRILADLKYFSNFHCRGYFHGNKSMDKLKTTSSFHHYNVMHLSSGGINLIHQKQHQIK